MEDHPLGVREASDSNPDRSIMAERERGPHPTLRMKGTKSHALLGKKIVLGVTGSIAAVKNGVSDWKYPREANPLPITDS